MRTIICEDKQDIGLQAAQLGSRLICKAIAEKGTATVVLATGLSQIELYRTLTTMPIPWEKTELFHLDEFVGLSADDPASFRHFLKTGFLDKVGTVGAFHPIEADSKDLGKEIERLNALLDGKEIDVLFMGIGENGHIAFNDPPANFETNAPYLVVDLDEKCRRQQVGEKWFPSLESVPRQAISMSVRQLLKARNIVCSVPDQRKARAVAMCLYDQVSPYSPCSVLRSKPECTLFLDQLSSMLVLGDRR
jgi:glucosamine-6-phosphate deaminase